ncbi:MAG: LPS export ABC transporter periplasmic protein LptC [Thiohalobacterales bacterium]|nr:LPS export ABC transporter periplasmic protein LptC [Thiohalobacterales bacterium]
MNAGQVITGLALLLLAGVIVVLNQQNYVPGQTGQRDTGVDAFVDGMVMDIMDENGVPVYRMTSVRMRHYDDTDLLELEQPVVHITRADGSKWELRAEHGEATSSGDRVWLRGSVALQREAGRQFGPMQITSRDVEVRPVEKIAETASAATIVTDNYRIEAVGLKADFTTNRLELHSRVRGTIDGAG